MRCCGCPAHQRARTRMFASPAAWGFRSITIRPKCRRGSTFRRENPKAMLVGIKRHEGVAEVHLDGLLQDGNSHRLPTIVETVDLTAAIHMETKLGATARGGR